MKTLTEKIVVSVIVPCYNQASFLKDLLCSVSDACSAYHEVIVIDDGSTQINNDFFLNEARAFSVSKKQQELVVIKQPNSGLASTRNVGLNIARGEFIQFLDADDLLFPGKIDKQLSVFDTLLESSVNVCDYMFCNKERSHFWGPDVSTIKEFTLDFESILVNWERGLSIPIHCGLFRSKALKNLRFVEGFRAKEDYLFWLTLAAKGTIMTYSDFHGAIYRQHGDNMCADRSAMGLAWLQAIDYLEKSDLTFDRKKLIEPIKHFNKFYLSSLESGEFTPLLTIDSFDGI